MIEKLRKHSILLLAFLLLLPTSIQLAHAFEQHEHVICSSDAESHIHQDDVECFLCHLQGETFAIVPNETSYFAEKQIKFNNNRNYQFLFNHQQLSFSLRGPPIFNLL